MTIKQLELFCAEPQSNILDFSEKSVSEQELSIWRVKEADRHHFLVAMPFEQIEPSAKSCVYLRVVKCVDDFTIDMVFQRSTPWSENPPVHQPGPTSLKDLAEVLTTPIGSKPQNICMCEADRIYHILSAFYDDSLKNLKLMTKMNQARARQS